MSINNITYLDKVYPHGILFFNKPTISRFYFSDYIEVKLFLDRLHENKVYVISFNWVMSQLNYSEDSPLMTLSDPILITKNSNPKLISKFIRDQIKLASDIYFIDEDIANMLIESEGPGVICKFNEINLF